MINYTYSTKGYYRAETESIEIVVTNEEVKDDAIIRGKWSAVMNIEDERVLSVYGLNTKKEAETYIVNHLKSL